MYICPKFRTLNFKPATFNNLIKNVKKNLRYDIYIHTYLYVLTICVCIYIGNLYKNILNSRNNKSSYEKTTQLNLENANITITYRLI